MRLVIFTLIGILVWAVSLWLWSFNPFAASLVTMAVWFLGLICGKSLQWEESDD